MKLEITVALPEINKEIEIDKESSVYLYTHKENVNEDYEIDDLI